MTCADFRRRCLCFRAFFGEIGLGRTLSEADASADHRLDCERCDFWYRDRLEEERCRLRPVVL
jgi:hypothetical protein